MGQRRIQNLFNQLIFVGPALLIFIVITMIPFLYNIIYSMSRWNGISPEMEFVGLLNFKNLFASKDFLHAFWFTTRITVVVGILTNILGMLLALALTRPMNKLRGAYRTGILLPNMISGVILGFIWKFIFINGFTAIGEATGWSFFKMPWLSTEATAFWAIVIVSSWQLTGYVMIIYIAGLGGVGADMREAADIDGANSWQTFWRITVPLIMPAITISVFWTLNRMYALFDLPFSLTGGGPFNSSMTLSMEIYNEAFLRHNYGLGSAKSIVFFLVICTISMLQVRASRRREVEL